MNSVYEHLKKYGYDLQYSMDDDLCTEALLNHLGRKKYFKFWNYVFRHQEKHGTEGVEKAIRDYIGNDEKHLKILLSGQILISVKILEAIIDVIRDLHLIERESINILELGGFDGWASDYLNSYVIKNAKLDIVDLESPNAHSNPNIGMIRSSYSAFNSNKKYDVVFSILGIELSKFDEMLDCLVRNTESESLVFLGLRVQGVEYELFLEKCRQYGFEAINHPTKTISVQLGTGTQVFPLFEMKRK